MSLSQEDHNRLWEYRLDYWLGPEGDPPRKQRLRMSNRSHKQRRQYSRPVENKAIRYTSTSEGW